MPPATVKAEPATIQPYRVFSDGFESDGTCPWSVSTEPRSCAPVFPGVTLLIPTDRDEVTIAWATADDDSTPPQAMTYRIHLSTEQEFVPGPESLATTVVGGNQAVVVGLVPATEYAALVIAEDGDGLTSQGNGRHRFQTPGMPTVLSPTVPLETGEGLHLGPATIDGTDLVFDTTGPEVQPTVGAVLIGELAAGGLFMRRVEGVSSTGGQMVVATSPAPMDAAVDQIHLHSLGALVDLDQQRQKRIRAADRGVEHVEGSLRVASRALAGGGRATRARWPGSLLTVETVHHASDAPDLAYRTPPGSSTTVVAAKDLDVGKITLDATVEFRPELETDARWSPAGVRTAEVIARGTLSLEALARYEWSAASSYDATIPIWSTDWISVYSAGPVPVYQKITLDLEAQLSASASAGVVAQAVAGASSYVEVGARYDEQTGWEPVAGFGFERSLTADLSVAGSVQGEVRIVPKLQVEFYEAVAAWISVEPSLSGSITAEGTLQPMCSPIELTAFDFDLEVEANVGIDLTILGDYTLFESTVWDPDPWRLFDLPRADPSFEGAGPVTVFANVTDGAGNPLDPASVQWEVTPETTGVIEPDPADPTIARLTCSVEDTYTVAFSGHGSLGEPARGCEELDVECWPTGPVRAWGYNWRGGLGDGTETDRSAPGPVNKLPDATAISAGYLTSYAVREDGTVWAWGYNPFGEIDPGVHGSGTLYPIQIAGLEDMVAVSGYYRTILALKADGTVWAWGYNGYGQIGDGTTEDRLTPVQVPGLANVIAIETGQDHSLALAADGTVWAWGGNKYGQLGDGTMTDRPVPGPVPGLSNIISISAGQYHSLALEDADRNTVWGWGLNSHGATGTGGSTLHQTTAAKVQEFDDVRFIRAGSDYSYAIKQDGTLWGWGYNGDYQLGDGTDVDRLEPVWVHELENVRTASAGFLHNLVVKDDGTVWVWGYCEYGVLGDGAACTEYHPPSLWTPVRVINLSGPAAVSATWFHTLAITE
ncbi:MAG TPA: hypothetical protein VLT32_24120 [Candidatus Sulfomarinibacteraceae bacterium]|nr:hypothetical protein [Candidatus Sulfomarinibacteraceae bacterium]